MVATKENVEEFLKKRDIEADIQQLGVGNFKIDIRLHDMEKLTMILSNISEGSRFVVGCNQVDLIRLLVPLLDEVNERLKREERKLWWQKGWIRKSWFSRLSLRLRKHENKQS